MESRGLIINYSGSQYAREGSRWLINNYTRKHFYSDECYKENTQHNVLTKGATSDWVGLGMTFVKVNLNENKPDVPRPEVGDYMCVSVDGTAWQRP